MNRFQRLGNLLARGAERYVPDPWILALLLTALTYFLVLVLTPTQAGEALGQWVGGFKDLLAFGMQISLILVTGHAVATSPPIAKFLNALSRVPRNGKQAALLVTLCSTIGAWLHWGLGLIAGAVLVRELGIRARNSGLKINYPILGAAGYAGLCVWHGGLSGSAPLAVNSQDHPLFAEIGRVSTESTLFGAMNLATTAVVVLLLCAFFYLLHPDQGGTAIPESAGGPEARAKEEKPATLAARLEGSRWIGWALGILGLLGLFLHQDQTGEGLGLDSMNAALLFLGIFLHGSPASFLGAVKEGIKTIAGVVLQFPFYAGILGLMKASGLAVILSEWLTGAATADTLPVLVFLSAGIVNLFVPSGGGQWAIQGPIVVQAAQGLDVPVSKIVMAVAYGDQWTNLIQPFWALPLLGMTGLKAREIMGYSAGALLFTGFLFAGGLLWKW